jgi:hypothetical protein
MQMTGLSNAPTAYQAKRNGAAHPDDVISAIKEAKSRRARERNLIRIFLSHKKKDFKAANQIREVLRLQSAGRIDVFMSENITKGDDWQARRSARRDAPRQGLDHIGKRTGKGISALHGA